MIHRFFSAAAFAASFTVPAWASDGVEVAPATSATEDQGAIVVTGERLQYGARETCTATRTCTDVQDVPQSLSVVTEAQIEDQALRSVSDVLMYVPGTAPGTGEGNRDQVTLRGNNTTADFFVNGIRDDVQYFRDLYNSERIEILRGPNAMIFGRGGGGGVINRVTKRPSGSGYREFAAAGDSEGGYRLTGDVDLALGNGDAGLRINGVYENGESFRRFVELERFGINPTAGVTLGDTRIDASYEYFHDRRTADRGVPADGDRPLKGYRSTFFGDPDLSFSEVDAHVASIAVRHEFAGGLTLRHRTQFGHYDKFYQNIYPSDLLEVSRRVRLSAYNTATERENLFSQTDLVREGKFAGIDQTFLLGFEIGRQDTSNRRLTGYFRAPNGQYSAPNFDVPLASPTVAADLQFKPSATDADNQSRAHSIAIYAQDQVRLSPQLELVLGLRFDRFTLKVDNFRNGLTFKRTDTLFSPRAGLIFKPRRNLSLYASYSRSFLPSSGDQFGSLDVTSAALKPERFDNYELGAKWTVAEGLLATAAIYQLDRTNTRSVDPVTNLTVLTGAQRSRGVEIGLERNMTDKWQVSGGYAWQEARIRSRTTACNPDLDSCRVALVPRHQFSLWNRYNFSKRLGVGLGVIARSKSFASISNDVVLPSYIRADAALFFELTKSIEAQVNVENLFGANYFGAAHNDNNIAPGAPRPARATLRFRF